MNFQCFAIVTMPFTTLAININRWQEMHLNLKHPVPLTLLTPAAFYIKAKTARAISTNLRCR